jgi:hypothetical protein
MGEALLYIRTSNPGSHLIISGMISLSGQKDTYLMPMTIESGPTKASTRVSRKPAFFIQSLQSAPV